MCVSEHSDSGSTLHKNVTGSAGSKFEPFVSSWVNTAMLLRDEVRQTGHRLLTRASPIPEQPAYSPALVLFTFLTGLLLQDTWLCSLMAAWAVDGLGSQTVLSLHLASTTHWLCDFGHFLHF